MLFSFSWYVVTFSVDSNILMVNSSVLFSYSLAPLVGWLADVRFGRYEVLRFGPWAALLASILYYFAMITEGSDSTLSNVLMTVAIIIASLGSACYSAAIIPFLTDQIVGATSTQLSAVVRWYYWAYIISNSLAYISVFYYKSIILHQVSLSLIIAIPLVVIIISDCLCQQWLDRTHKVTNPIKLIIQVLNYTRKHRYPERRSAFTYIDEEQPTRMDYGKEKFGGPFTEEEVEDVKTVLRLLPLVICLTISVALLEAEPIVFLFNNDAEYWLLDSAIIIWVLPITLIPLYQLLLYRCFHNYSPSMLRFISVGLFMCTFGFICLIALGLGGVLVSGGTQRYLSCEPPNGTYPGDYMEWYWKLDPSICYSIGNTIIEVLLFELIIAQSPDKMKGLVIGVSLAFEGLFSVVASLIQISQFTLCYDLSISLVLVVLFLVFLVLSKRYTLRERNREVNIQAIVEEHYERYMDQEEEYMRQPHY